MEENFTFVVSGVARSEEDVRGVAKELVGQLKDMMWREVWRDEIVLPGVVVTYREREGGGFIVVAKVRGSGE